MTVAARLTREEKRRLRIIAAHRDLKPAEFLRQLILDAIVCDLA